MGGAGFVTIIATDDRLDIYCSLQDMAVVY